VKGAGAAILNTWQGRASVGALAIMLGLSVYVVLVFPLDYGPRFWNNPSHWAEYPKAVPPAWSGPPDAFPHTILRLERTSEAPGEFILYEAVLDLAARVPPNSVTITLRGVEFGGRAPLMVLSMYRPDGLVVTLLEHVPPAGRPGEDPPYRRYFEEPFRFFPTASPQVVRGLADALSRTYGYPISVEEVSKRPELYLFSHPLAGGGYEIVRGRYLFRLELYGNEPGDSVAEARVVLGGSVFGAMGTDILGRDLAEGLLFGFPVSLFVGLVAAGIVTLIGSGLGLLSGYLGGRADILVQRAADVTANIPLLPLLILLAYTFRPGLITIILLLTLFSWPGLTILVRSMVLQLRESQLVESARALGAPGWRIMLRHIAPHVAPYILGQVMLAVPSAILTEAALSFIGLGDPQIPTWGSILELAFRTGAVFVGYWWWVVPPGALLAATSVSFILLSLSLEPYINPRLATRGGSQPGQRSR